MDDNVVRLSVIGRIIRRRWRLLTVLAVLGGLLGVGASLLLSPGYESASKVLLQGLRDEQVVLTETQIARSSVVLDRAAAALGWGVPGEGLRTSVDAAVVDGNVIEIRGRAAAPDRAQQLADRVTQEYVKFSTQITTDAANASEQLVAERRAGAQRRIDETNARIADLQRTGAASVQARAELDRLRATVADATRELAELDRRGLGPDAEAPVARTSISVIEPATLPTSAAAPTLVHFVLGGAGLFFLLGTFALQVALRLDGRLRSTSEIAAALGSPVIGSVGVPAVPSARRAKAPSVESRGLLNRLRRLLRDDLRFDGSEIPTAGNDRDQQLRYRRVLARLRGKPDRVLRLLVLLANDDATAQRAVAQLAVAAGRGGGPASLVTDRPELAAMVRAAADTSPDPDDVRLTVLASSDPVPDLNRTVLSVIDISAARPTVPDCGPVSGAMVAVTAGTRTAWELVGIAEACVDAGHTVVGALVAYVARPADDPSQPARADSPGNASQDAAVDAADDALEDTSEQTRNGSAMAGSS